MNNSASASRRTWNRVMNALVWASAVLVIVLVAGILGMVLVRGIPHISWKFLTTTASVLKGTDGILPAILNTLYVILLTLLIVLPLGVGAAVYLTEYAQNRKVISVIEFTNETLAGIPSIIYGLVVHAGVPSEMIEWHGHNDFYKAVSNSTTAWLYGCSGVNTSLFGIGERTGNTPLEAMVFEYAQLRGTLDGMDTTVITEMADYYEKEIGYRVPSRTPFVGKNFNVTRAGIHADGLLKNEEIYIISTIC